MSSSTSDKKRSSSNASDNPNKRSRKWKQQFSSTKHSNPKRGPPGILFTCEPFHARKAKFEGLDILQYDWDTNVDDDDDVKTEETTTTTNDNNKTDAKKSVSLDDELNDLKKSRNDKSSSPFAIYDFGCKGNVLVLCPGAKCIVQPPPSTMKCNHKNTEKGGDEEKKQDESALTEEVKIKGKTEQRQPYIDRLPKWDPFQCMRRFSLDMMKDNTTTASAVTKCVYPGTRHITRMIPMQTTCFANIEEITYMVTELLKQHTDSSTAKSNDGDNETTKTKVSGPTFAIQTKRRLCNHITRPQLIDCVGAVVGRYASHWTVDLTNPTYVISIEICKSTAGVSIYKNDVSASNSSNSKQIPFEFNLVTLRAKLAAAVTNDDSK